MKKIIIVCFLFILLYLSINFVFHKKQLTIINSPIRNSFVSPSPLPTSSVKSSTVSWNGIAYVYEYFVINDITQLTLIANFTQKKTSELLIKENSCQYAINGGYYDKNDKPLGLFINSSLKTQSIESALINGYLSISNKPTISFDPPDNPIIALQTGPILIVDGKKLKLAINNDEHARRMVAGISSKETLVFMTIYIPTSFVQGPQLEDLPDIIEQINKTLPNPLVSAINLDGGNASMFKNKDVYIPEVLPIGSLFCIQE